MAVLLSLSKHTNTQTALSRGDSAARTLTSQLVMAVVLYVQYAVVQATQSLECKNVTEVGNVRPINQDQSIR